LIKDSFVEEVALDRLEVCEKCESNTTNPEVTMFSRCSICHCVLEAKSRNLESDCPANKWKKLEKVEV
jgi:hypothetical protein